MAIKLDLIFLVDDNETDLLLQKDVLTKVFAGAEVQTFTTGEACLEGLQKEKPEILILDLSLPDFNGLDLLSEISDQGIEVATIIVTGQGYEEAAVKAMHNGAMDYVTKHNDNSHLHQLPSRVENAVNRFHNRQIFKITQRMFEERSRLIQQLRTPLIVVDLNSTIKIWNQGAKNLWGWPRTDTINRPLSELVGESLGKATEAVVKDPAGAETLEGRFESRDMVYRSLEVNVVFHALFSLEGRLSGVALECVCPSD